MNTAPSQNILSQLRDEWLRQWPAALEAWSRYTKLSEPRWCFSDTDEKSEGLTQSFAMIRLNDQAVVISLPQVNERKLQRFAREIMAHEIGHHIYCPANLTDHGRMIARMRAALPTKEHLAPFVANLYADLLINDRLQRGSQLDMAGVYKALSGDLSADSDKGSILSKLRPGENRIWTLYMRMYECLWSLQKGSLSEGKIDGRMEGDAQLGSRVIRSFANDWLEGAGRFAALCLPYLIEDEGQDLHKLLKGWTDTCNAGGSTGGDNDIPAGLTEIEEGEREGAIHPALDPELSGIDDVDESDTAGAPNKELPANTSPLPSGGQHREPFEYGQILRSLGLDLTDHEIAVRYYRERAAPHLVKFPTRRMPESIEPQLEGLQSWEFGEPFENLDLFESVLSSPRIVPGMTTVQRTWGVMSGGDPDVEPIDLDLYVDCSGSMPNPPQYVSYLTLAGAIVALSALRVGARVQATLWSGAGQFETTNGFVRDSREVLRILTGYLGGGTAFPIHLLRSTYQDRKPSDRAVHILVISDDGVDTMFNKDELGNSGWDVSHMAMEKSRGGGTLVLNLVQEWQDYDVLKRAHAMGFEVHQVATWEDLTQFARAFSRAKYGDSKDAKRRPIA